MVKKLSVYLSVLAFASFSSVALACDTSCKGKGDKGDAGTDTEISGAAYLDVAKSGCGGGSKCGGKKDDGSTT